MMLPMAKMREIKGRIRAVSNIERITKTMQMIATARFQAAVRRATASRPYAHEVGRLAADLASAAGSIQHPLLRAPQPPAGRELLLVITSNRGLCGAYNSNVLHAAAQELKERAQDTTDLEVVGRKGNAYFRFNRYPIAAFHQSFTDRPQFAQVEPLARQYIDRFSQGNWDAVKVVYMAFESMARQYPTVMTLLPLAQPGESRTPGSKVAQAPAPYEFSPPPPQLMAELLPVTVKVRLFQAFIEASVSEHLARMRSMKSATDAAGDVRRRLSRQFNRARQTAITTELSEIIGGAAALG